MIVLTGILLVTHQYWLFPAGMLPSPSRDLKSNLLPVLMYREQIFSGELPLRSPWYSSESNLLNPLWNFLYFPATIFFLLLPVTLGLRVVVLLHIVIGWVTMYLFAKAYTRHLLPPFFGAFLYVFSGTWAARLTSYHFEKMFGLALLPLVFYFYKKIYDWPSTRHSWFLAIALAGLIYAGALYIWVFATFALIVMTLAMYGQRPFPKTQLNSLIKSAIFFFILSSPKLIPNLFSGVSSERPDFAAARLASVTTTYSLPGETWLWLWNETTNYISMAGIILGLIGLAYLGKSSQRRWGVALVGAILLMFYWSLGFPPFGVPYPLTQLREASRALLITAPIVCLFASLGLDAILLRKARVSKIIWAVAILGFIAELVYMAVRSNPTSIYPLTNLFSESSLNTTLEINLWVNKWNAYLGWGLALIFLFTLYLGLKRTNIKTPTSAKLLAFMALFSVASAMSSHSLAYETDPRQDKSLLRLREEVSGSTIALANFKEKDVRGRVSYALAGSVHLLNPYYGAFGQDVSQHFVDELDYIVSNRKIAEGEDISIQRWWSPGGMIAIIPHCQVVYWGEYQTEDPLTRKDVPEITAVAQIETKRSEIQPLYLYKVDTRLCGGSP